MAASSSSSEFFEAAAAFAGARPGRVFKMGNRGLGYYLDLAAGGQAASSSSSGGLAPELEELRKRLPETWRGCKTLRQERLRVDPEAGAGLALRPCDFGFAVDSVDEQPGQAVQEGDVIVAVEGRLMAGLSAPQMQASFQKRRVEGARLQVAQLSEVEYLSKCDPAVVEGWDAKNQRPYYFHKKTGKSAWTREELAPPPKAEGASKPAPPVDLAAFLSHGFAKPAQAPKKRKAVAQQSKTEAQLAREEKERWDHWNSGERGGYTEQFLEKYRGCQAFAPKEKPDKRLKGSVGPGQGMEYMARWTGSNNSFN